LFTWYTKPMKEFHLISIFPNMLDSYFGESILGRAQKSKKIKIVMHDLRDWATDKHKTTDDVPFGGGAGMVMKIEPIFKALTSLKALKGKKTSRTILLSASGAPFTQQKAKELAKYKKLVFICGRYEGVDHRVSEHLVDESLSIGPYVLTGGELAAAVIVDSVARLEKGVLGNQNSLSEESHNDITEATQETCLEYPQYTRPAKFSPKRGISWDVPEVLLSGNHALIKKWRDSLFTDKK
jgi:tRNA (guanine37-N1)-methyltransferase